ncbi:MAG: hypothetical protein E7069_00470 [Bacteroidales bacterium]|jgi:hypothetical protein|nr:hypothetical protein [Bacteroidales bacterium]
MKALVISLLLLCTTVSWGQKIYTEAYISHSPSHMVKIVHYIESDSVSLNSYFHKYYVSVVYPFDWAPGQIRTRDFYFCSGSFEGGIPKYYGWERRPNGKKREAIAWKAGVYPYCKLIINTKHADGFVLVDSLDISNGCSEEVIVDVDDLKRKFSEKLEFDKY